jgi:mannose-6-phosphate isomerase-like protein (cupin superfamily)
MNPIKLKPANVRKRWGGETVICNNEEFCGKMLRFKAGAKFSMHFHRDKREVFHVLSGYLMLTTINTETAQQRTIYLSDGATVEIPRLLPHRLTAMSDSVVIEFSTRHRDSDSYRVAPGDSQK